MKKKNIHIIFMLLLSAAVVLVCGVSELPADEQWCKTEVPPAELVVTESVPVIPEVVPVAVSAPVIEPEEVPAVEPDVPEVVGSGEVFLAGANDGEPVFFQWQYLPTRQGYLFGHERKVYGLSLGYYLPQSEIYGVSLSFMHIYNVRKYGLSLSILEMSGEIGGVTLFLAGGAVSNRGLAVGLLNLAEDNHGLQIGLVNMSEEDLLLDYPQKPHREEEESSFGIQAGLVNFSDARGIQFGLWNVNPNSWIKYFPIFNFCL